MKIKSINPIIKDCLKFLRKALKKSLATSACRSCEKFLNTNINPDVAGPIVTIGMQHTK